MVLQAAAFRSAEDVLTEQLEKSMTDVQATIGKGTCPSHDALAHNAVLQTQTLGIFVSYLRSPLVKIITAILTLGGTAATALFVKEAMRMAGWME